MPDFTQLAAIELEERLKAAERHRKVLLERMRQERQSHTQRMHSAHLQIAYLKSKAKAQESMKSYELASGVGEHDRVRMYTSASEVGGDDRVMSMHVRASEVGGDDPVAGMYVHASEVGEYDRVACICVCSGEGCDVCKGARDWLSLGELELGVRTAASVGARSMTSSSSIQSSPRGDGGTPREGGAGSNTPRTSGEVGTPRGGGRGEGSVSRGIGEGGLLGPGLGVLGRGGRGGGYQGISSPRHCVSPGMVSHSYVRLC